MKRYAFIYNPAARGGNSGSTLATLEKRIKQLPEAKLFRSEFNGDIAGLVSRIIEDFDVFVACGGDGTVREVASQLISTEKSLGIIPMGTGNDLCKTLKIPSGIKAALEILFEGESKMIDVGRCNDCIFLNSLGFGFDGLTNRYAEKLKRFPPVLRYAIAALKASVYQSPFNLQINNENGVSRQELVMITLANGRVEGGSFWIAPEASLTDGKLNLITISPINKWLIPILLPFIILKKPGWIPQVKSIEVDKTELHFKSEVAIHADGEIINSKESKFTISLIPNGLEVICRR